MVRRTPQHTQSRSAACLTDRCRCPASYEPRSPSGARPREEATRRATDQKANPSSTDTALSQRASPSQHHAAEANWETSRGAEPLLHRIRYVRATDCRGSLSAAPSPISAIAARTIIAAAYDVLSRLDTRIVPAIPVPSVEPRLEMQRDRPEISPCCDSGNADCTTLTEGVRITPRPGPMKSRPGANAHALGEPLTSESKITTPTIVVMKPVMISVRCAYFFASRSAASEDTRMPPVAAVKITPV